ncbi:hypothetical protein [Azospirillum sp. HJ39]
MHNLHAFINGGLPNSTIRQSDALRLICQPMERLGFILPESAF